jgi:hypothetical protein
VRAARIIAADDGRLEAARPASAIRELVTGAAHPTSGSVFSASIVIPAEQVRVFRIDY